ncbi:MAG: phosphoenolpyruvate synthase, partial [Myxococcales bacterium]|nr:phosphoenolpyruvate synthase [Myxococcales bacterium]
MSDAALVLDFAALASEPGALARVGGKGANLGILAGAGFPVPPGFCLTTAAFRRFMAEAGSASEIEVLYAGLDEAGGGAAMRTHLEAQPIPPEIIAATLAAWRALGSEHAYAVRSSATAEDLPGASFAGQQDTYLNIVGEAALLDAIRRCWASLFTDRAIAYRRSAGFSHRAVELSVVVQRMVLPQSSGVLFTADPLGGKRGRIVIDASFGLGEA